MKIKGVIEDLKKIFLIKTKKKNDRKNSKNISKTSLELLQTVWGQFIFR